MIDTRDEQQEPNIKWNSLDSLISIIFLIAILVGIYFGSQKLLSMLNEKQLINLNSSNISNLSFSIFYAIQTLLMLGVVWFFAIYWRGASIKDLGFRYYSILKTIWYTFISLLFIFLISFLYILALKSIFGIEAPPSKIDELVANRNISSNILIIVTAVVAPFCEEIYFRGFLYPAFRKNFGVLIALFLSSFLFSLAHLELYSFIPLMVFGWLLAYIYEKTKSIFTVIFLHAVYNLILISILLGKINFLKLY
ncbi:MAG: CPBP family intramembrane metalloprotease [Bacteroidetes bacterium]|nr:CPBP family intramembrane metalloprotease [Bacteroidota bacterium]